MSVPTNNVQACQIYKRRPSPNGFDFWSYVHKKLVDKASPYNKLCYSEVYKILGQNFCFSKAISKQVLTGMQERGLLTKQKRGCLLC